jgi:hypothetical protein
MADKHSKPPAKPQSGQRRPPAAGDQPGVMGDETIEQDLGQRGHPERRITRDEVAEAFRRKQLKDKS